MTDGSAQPSTPSEHVPREETPLDAAESADAVQRMRAITGLFVVVVGDVVIAVAAIVGLVVLDSSHANSQAVAILTSAFTAISSLTTAYFGIRAATNTAQSSIAARRD
jgi:hypothetical protein